MYAGLQSTATRLLKKFGKSADLVSITETGFDPITGQPGTTTTTTSVSAVFVGIKSKWTDKFAVEQGDAVALVESGTEPKQNDTLDGRTVIAVEPLKPADTVLRYLCHLRQ